jgi:polyhydroxybutyrate depolymerase
MMSHRLACQASDLFRAVASVAGTDVTPKCAPTNPVSVLHIHAKDHNPVLFGGGAGPSAFRDLSNVSALTLVSETMAHWARRKRCGAAFSKGFADLDAEPPGGG